ncbi:MAG: hypothetical protein ABSB58_06635 [Gemmatimonadales bacterium]
MPLARAARAGRAAAALGALCVALAAALATPALSQQVPAPTPRDTVLRHDTGAARVDSVARPRADTQAARGDSVRPVSPVTPGGAFLRSLVIPGWGQARLGRNVTGGLFLLFEGIAGAMVWKANWQLDWARTRDKFVASHRQEREDWIVLLVFNHLVSGAEAYVSALLYDFPAALKAQRLPGGATGVGVSIPLP